MQANTSSPGDSDKYADISIQVLQRMFVLLDILAERIQHRGDATPEEVKERLERARFEMTFAPQCHYLILNDAVDEATEQLKRIIASERARHRGAVAA